MDRGIPVRISLTELTGNRRAWLLPRASASRLRIITLATFYA
jgi:hypothetical protein